MIQGLKNSKMRKTSKSTETNNLKNLIKQLAIESLYSKNSNTSKTM